MTLSNHWLCPVPDFCHSTPRTNILQLILKGIFRNFSVVGSLNSQPIAIGQTKEATKSQVRVRGYRTLSSNNLADSLSRHPNFFSQTVLRNAHRLKKLFLQ